MAQKITATIEESGIYATCDERTLHLHQGPTAATEHLNGVTSEQGTAYDNYMSRLRAAIQVADQNPDEADPIDAALVAGYNQAIEALEAYLSQPHVIQGLEPLFTAGKGSQGASQAAEDIFTSNLTIDTTAPQPKITATIDKNHIIATCNGVSINAAMLPMTHKQAQLDSYSVTPKQARGYHNYMGQLITSRVSGGGADFDHTTLEDYALAIEALEAVFNEPATYQALQPAFAKQDSALEARAQADLLEAQASSAAIDVLQKIVEIPIDQIDIFA